VRSIFAKVLFWSLGTFAASLVAYGAIHRGLQRRGPREADPFPRLVALAEADACRAFEEGGTTRLAAYLRRLDANLPGEHYLTDPDGRDLVSGVDRSGLLRFEHGHHGHPGRLPDGRVVFVRRHAGGQYRFITVIPPWFDGPDILPYYGAVVLVIVGMGAALAVHLAAPLRALRRVVDRFGQGDLSARAHSARRDEIGELSSAFDRMANRIETLLAAERRLLQDVSHELRSPLARLGFAVALARSGPDRDGALDRIDRDVGRLSALVAELLELTRAEGDPAAWLFEDVRLDTILQAVVDDCAIEAAAKGCRLDLRGGGPAAVVRGDRELLRRAFENVLRNAIRHAPEGTVVDVDLALKDHRITISVRDYGPGVPDEALGSLFEPFFRVEGHRSRASGGVGLGLAITRRALALHGGTASAANARPGLLVTLELERRGEC
jgi:two-component system sensor histidine kinase CpxA